MPFGLCLKTYQPLIVVLTFRGVLMSVVYSLCLSLFIFVHKSSRYTYIYLSIQPLYLSLLTFSHSNVCILQFISSPLAKKKYPEKKMFELVCLDLNTFRQEEQINYSGCWREKAQNKK